MLYVVLFTHLQRCEIGLTYQAIPLLFSEKVHEDCLRSIRPVAHPLEWCLLDSLIQRRYANADNG